VAAFSQLQEPYERIIHRSHSETRRKAYLFAARWPRHAVRSLSPSSGPTDRNQALKFLGPQDNNANPVPWQRVIASDGTISSRAGADRQRQALEAEGVEVTTGRTGDMRVNLQQYGWFPAVGTVNLPVQATAEAEAAVDEEQW
jgi:methylated-DNA-protein-cysteine methyltransferase-like protein